MYLPTLTAGSSRKPYRGCFLEFLSVQKVGTVTGSHDYWNMSGLSTERCETEHARVVRTAEQMQTHAGKTEPSFAWSVEMVVWSLSSFSQRDGRKSSTGPHGQCWRQEEDSPRKLSRILSLVRRSEAWGKAWRMEGIFLVFSPLGSRREQAAWGIGLQSILGPQEECERNFRIQAEGEVHSWLHVDNVTPHYSFHPGLYKLSAFFFIMTSSVETCVNRWCLLT